MRPRTTTLLIATTLAAGLATAGPAAAADCTGADATPGTVSAKVLSSATLCLLNEQRAHYGLGPLKAQRSLAKAATHFSDEMVVHKFFNHVSPGGSTLVSRLKKVRYTSSARAWSIGENIAWGTNSESTPAAIVDAWMHSAGHKANILDHSFKEIGIGIADGAPVDTSASIGATYTTDFGYRS
jgi:uncharacterized protein YkwD